MTLVTQHQHGIQQASPGLVSWSWVRKRNRATDALVPGHAALGITPEKTRHPEMQ